MVRLPQSHRQPSTETDHLDISVNFTLGPSIQPQDIILTQLWLYVLQNTQSPVNGQAIPLQPVDSQADIEERCLWLPRGGDSPCGHRVYSRNELVEHLNYSHGVNGSAKQQIQCRWAIDANNMIVCGREVHRANFSRHIDTHLRTTFSCPHPGCAKSYCRLDVLRKHLKTHSG
ncbi:hypothetical protein EDD15DRAFT_2292245 [Pisolithus albus]|nr:hypothetical protein EDD15DRAFT_2292245 [Pisolithus albus]